MAATSFDTAEGRQRLDKLLGEWISQRTLDECVETMKRLEVVASKIYNVKDILEDETFRERENIVTVDDPDLGKLRMQNVIPRLTNYTGSPLNPQSATPLLEWSKAYDPMGRLASTTDSMGCHKAWRTPHLDIDSASVIDRLHGQTPSGGSVSVAENG